MRVYATDWAPDAHGFSWAHESRVIDVKDFEATLAFAKEIRPDGVFTSADAAVQTLSKIVMELGLIGPTSAQADIATDKFVMRTWASENLIACPRYELIDAHRVQSHQVYPTAKVVKPVDCNGSEAVRFVNPGDDASPCIRDAIKSSFKGMAIIEDYLTGDEGSIEILAQGGEYLVLGLCKKTKSELPYRYDLLLEYPGDFSHTEHSRIEAFGLAIASEIALRDGILHIEFKIHKCQVSLIEFAIRACGGRVISDLLPALTQLDIARKLLELAVGHRSPVPALKSRVGHLCFLEFHPGTKHLANVALKPIRGLLDSVIYEPKSGFFSSVNDAGGRHGYALLASESRSQAHDNLRSFARELDKSHGGLRWPVY